MKCVHHSFGVEKYNDLFTVDWAQQMTEYYSKTSQ